MGARGVVQSVEHVGDSGPGSKPGGRAAGGGRSIAARDRGDLVWRGGADEASIWAAASRMARGPPRAPRPQPPQPGGGSPFPGPRGVRAAHSPRTGDVSSTQTATQSRLGCPPAARRPGQLPRVPHPAGTGRAALWQARPTASQSPRRPAGRHAGPRITGGPPPPRAPPPGPRPPVPLLPVSRGPARASVQRGAPRPLSASGLLFPRLPVVWFRVSRTQHSLLPRLGGPWPAEAHTHPLASAPPGSAARNALSLMRSSVRACGGSNRCIVPTGVFV